MHSASFSSGISSGSCGDVSATESPQWLRSFQLLEFEGKEELSLSEATSIAQVDPSQAWNLGIAPIDEHLDRVLPVVEDDQHDGQVALDSCQPEAVERDILWVLSARKNIV